MNPAVALLLLALWPARECPGAAEEAGSKHVTPLRIARVWSGHPVGFFLLTHSNRQFAAYYDENRQMTVASRHLDEQTWKFTTLPERVVWDSHNYITMAMDKAGHLHLSGNMHGNPLVYFRSERPLDATSLRRVSRMTGVEEARTTYPVFMDGPEGKLVFTYRSGGSGRGNQFYNVYDPKTLTWKRLFDAPLLDGAGEKSAYLHGPKPGPDGWLHLCWVWRETPDCESSHYVCYARSRDWVNWETSTGKRLNLPITFQTGEVVDPVPIGGGVINGNVRLGFDAQRRPVVSYHKYDAQGFTQVYNARPEKEGWKIQVATQWRNRWEFKGRGSIDFEVRVGEVAIQPDGALAQNVSHRKYGASTIRLDPATLAPLPPVAAKRKASTPLPAAFVKVESTFPGMKVNRRASLGDKSPRGQAYWLKWDTLPPNRDLPRPAPLPPPSWLTLWEIEAAE